MNLDAHQQEKLAAWIQEGLSLSQIQSRLASELGIALTYMELRFLLDDLKLKPKDKESPRLAGTNLTAPPGPASARRAEPKAPANSKRPTDSVPEQSSVGDGRVAVTVDQVARPGALVSGQVSFTDGNSAEWHLDQFGRLGLAPKKTGYKPSQQDLMAFQTELQNELAKLGF
jgi:hypothetical protein